MKWAVSFPEESILLVRPCLVAICHDNRPAAKLLSVLLYRHSIRQEHQSDAESINEVRGDNSQDTTFRIYRKQSKLVTDMCNEITEKTLHDVAIPVLQLLGYLDVDETPAIHCYDLHIDVVVNALVAYKQGPKQLQQMLQSNLQLEKFLISIQLEKVLINKKNFQLALEKVLIANRNISNNKRGRKPRPDAPQEPQSEEAQINIEIDSKIGNREEGMSSPNVDDAPASENVSDITVWKVRKTEPRIPAMPKGQFRTPLDTTIDEKGQGEPEQSIPTEGLPAPAASTELPQVSVQQGAMAMTARQIKAQAERREKELWAIIEAERNTKYTETQRKLYENKEGMKCLIADDIGDEELREGLKKLDEFHRKTFTVLKFYGWLPNLSAKAPIPISNGKSPTTPAVNHELNQRKLEERKARFAAHG